MGAYRRRDLKKFAFGPENAKSRWFLKYFKELDENKITSDARKIFQAYGKSIFPYGFKCHWVIGKIVEEVSNASTCHNVFRM